MGSFLFKINQIQNNRSSYLAHVVFTTKHTYIFVFITKNHKYMSEKKTKMLIIKPIYDSCMSIPTSYIHKKLKQLVAINAHGRIVMGDDVDTEKLLRISMIPGSPHYEFEWNVGDEAGEAICQFWMEHPNCEPTHQHNPYLGSHLFDLKIPGYEEEGNYKKIKNTIQIINYINDLEGNEEELRNIAFFYNNSPIGKGIKSVFCDLIDTTPMQVGKNSKNEPTYVPKGILLRPGIVENFLETYTKNTDDARIRVNIRKAIALNIVEYKNEIYYLNNVPIGNNFEKLVMFVKENPDVYSQQIVPQIRQKDAWVPTPEPKFTTGDPSISNILEIKSQRVDSILDNKAEKNNLTREALSLKVQRAKTMGVDRLRQEIKDAKMLVKEAEDLGITGWSDRVEYVHELHELIHEAKKNKSLAQPKQNSIPINPPAFEDRPEMQKNIAGSLL